MTRQKKQNILVTGANGFVGHALTKKLVGNSNLFLVSRDEKFKCSGAKVFYGDLRNKKFCQKIVKNIDAVYYLAAFKKNVAVHTGWPFDAIFNNTLPLLTFLEAAKTSKIKTIIYVSSVLVEYALSQDIQIDGYVIGKYMNELILKSFEAQTKINVKIVRPPAVYGPGNDFNPEVAQVIPFFIMKTAESKDGVVLRSNGKRRLQFVYIDDFVANLIAIRNSPKNFFVIGNDETIEVKKLVSKIMRLIGKRLKIHVDLNNKDKPTKLDKFNNLIKPKTSLDAGLQKTLDYYLRYKNKMQ
ncbi:MAG: NAD(P)-dependent oxidoreductase [bacterium]|nr:NAD(P)-dependent oxidoreductase [bacterium]